MKGYKKNMTKKFIPFHIKVKLLTKMFTFKDYDSIIFNSGTKVIARDREPSANNKIKELKVIKLQP